jgi:hypothetical protein
MHTHTVVAAPSPAVLAAPAPANTTPADDDQAMSAAELETEARLHALCEAWSSWCRTRRFYGRPSMPVSLLGRLTARTRTSPAGGPDAICSAELSALHLAVLGQPAEALDRQVFELHYLWRVKNVKAAAATMGISRQHWYRLVRAFRARVCTAAVEIQRDNQAATVA